MNNKKRILLVEDDPNFGIILRDFLKMNEYDVILAKNGMEGFEKFKKFEFNLCILDVMMPYKDGFTLATEIKSVSPDIPIIFLTAKSMKEDVLKGYKVGAEISHVKENSFFVDEQRFGPYKFWHHKHKFEIIDGGVKIIDILDYSLPFGLIGLFFHPFLVKPKLDEIFKYREKKLIEIFGKL